MSMIHVTPRQVALGNFARDQGFVLGQIVHLMLRRDGYYAVPLGCLSLWIEPAVALDQVAIFYNDLRVPVGYVTWAWLSPDAEERLQADENFVLQFMEWNEGESLWLLDLFVMPGYGREAMRYIRNTLFPPHQEVSWLRRDARGFVRKTVRYRD